MLVIKIAQFLMCLENFENASLPHLEQIIKQRLTLIPRGRAINRTTAAVILVTLVSRINVHVRLFFLEKSQKNLLNKK